MGLESLEFFISIGQINGLDHIWPKNGWGTNLHFYGLLAGTP